MDKRKNPALGDGLLDLGMAEHGLAGLVGEGERAKRRIGKEAIDLRRKPRGTLASVFSARAKTLRLAASSTYRGPR